MPQVELIHLTKAFPATIAVDDLSLQIADGELLTVVGPSGCGKTTLLRLISGLETPSGGQIRFAGQVVTDVSPRNRNVAMVFQDAAIFPHLSVAGNLAFGPKLRGATGEDSQRSAGEAAELLGISDLLSRRANQLSGGQRQRVALGRAIVRRPQILLLDEPLSQLDEPLRQELRLEIRRIHQSLGLTTIYVTHDQSEALQLGQRVLVMRNGRLQQLGTPQEIYRQPANRFVAGFIGSPAMNVWRCQLDRKNSQLVVEKFSTPIILHSDLVKRMAGVPVRFQIGFRPEAVRPVSATGGNSLNAIRFEANVVAIDWMGDHQVVRLRANNVELAVARSAVEAMISAGQRQAFAIDFDSLHFFAIDGEQLQLQPDANLVAKS